MPLQSCLVVIVCMSEGNKSLGIPNCLSGSEGSLEWDWTGLVYGVFREHNRPRLP